MKRPVLVACSLPVLMLTVTVGFTMKAKADLRAHPPTPAAPTITVGDCTYLADGSGRCGAEQIPPLLEADADFCHDTDPYGTVIVLCRPGVYTGDVYQLRECGPGTIWFCPSYPGPVLPEDAPLWWCLTDGDESCGPAPVTVHDGVTCIRYTHGAVCQWPDGFRKAL